jgi:hypothetical protein
VGNAENYLTDTLNLYAGNNFMGDELYVNVDTPVLKKTNYGRSVNESTLFV